MGTSGYLRGRALRKAILEKLKDGKKVNDDGLQLLIECETDKLVRQSDLQAKLKTLEKRSRIKRRPNRLASK